MVFSLRHQRPRKTILPWLGSGMALLLAGCYTTRNAVTPDGRPPVSLPSETAGYGPIVKTLISAFDHTDLLIIGETHGRKMDSELRIQLVRDPEFVRKVHLIVVEFASTAQQPILDRYIQGEDVPRAELQQVWRNTTQTSGVWDSPVYAEFLAAVREVNLKLPASRRIHVLAGDPPPGGARMISVNTILKEQVLDRGAKALVLYGASHVYRAGAGVGGITKNLQPSYPGRIFVVRILGGASPAYQQFEGALKTTKRPVLISLLRAPFRDFDAEDFLRGENLMNVNGTWVPAPVFRGLTLGQVADACVYLGNSAEVETQAYPPR